MPKVINESIKKDFLIKFGKHIKLLREEQNLSQSQFANKCNTNIKKVGRTERGVYDFKISSLIVLAGGLNVSIDKLLDFEFPEGLIENFWIDKNS
jgi:transcriptional regulator with XRE-family HTH domain